MWHLANIGILLNLGPLAITVSANGWHEYQSGVYEGCPFDKDI